MSGSARATERLFAAGLAVVGLAAACTPSGASEASIPTPDGDRVEILAPMTGAEVSGPVTFVVDKGQVDTTGATVASDAGGSFWLVVDGDCAEVGDQVDTSSAVQVPPDGHEVSVPLSEGTHDVCLQFADATGAAYYETHQVTIRVSA